VTDDPRQLPGSIAGPGGPHDRHSVVLDTTHGVLLDAVDVAVGHNVSDGRDFLTMVLGGRVNRSQDRASVLYMLDADGAAAIVSELEAVMRRAGGNWIEQYRAAKADRVAKLKAGGNW
jgi:hypothetical protein